MLIVSADFHLLTFAAALSAPELYPFGGFTLLRGVAEPAARAAWIMEPNLSSRDRRARVLVERLYALQEMRKFKNQARPDATNLFGKLLPELSDPVADAPGSRLYRILSGFSHSTLWAILAQRESETDFQPGLKSAMIVLNVDWLIGQLGQVLKLHSIAMRRLASQIGEGPERWDRVLQGLPSPTGPGRTPTTGSESH
jgi:hypothetical protein